MYVSWKLYELLMSHKFNRPTNVKWFGCGISDAVLTTLIRSIRGGSFGRGGYRSRRGTFTAGKNRIRFGSATWAKWCQGKCDIIGERGGATPGKRVIDVIWLHSVRYLTSETGSGPQEWAFISLSCQLEFLTLFSVVSVCVWLYVLMSVIPCSPLTHTHIKSFHRYVFHALVTLCH